LFVSIFLQESTDGHAIRCIVEASEYIYLYGSYHVVPPLGMGTLCYPQI
jgi:hypothetical protein